MFLFEFISEHKHPSMKAAINNTVIQVIIAINFILKICIIIWNFFFLILNSLDPTDTDYQNSRLPYQSNEIIYSSLPGPPAPPPTRLYDLSHFQFPRRSIYTADSNYEVNVEKFILRKKLIILISIFVYFNFCSNSFSYV